MDEITPTPKERWWWKWLRSSEWRAWKMDVLWWEWVGQSYKMPEEVRRLEEPIWIFPPRKDGLVDWELEAHKRRRAQESHP